MVVAALQGHDGKFWPHSIDKEAPKSWSVLNIDAFSSLPEGGHFDKREGRTTATAIHDSRDTGHGVKIQGDDSNVFLGNQTEDETHEGWESWVASLEIDDDTPDGTSQNDNIYLDMDTNNEEVIMKELHVEVDDSVEYDDDDGDIAIQVEQHGERVEQHGELAVDEEEEKQLNRKEKVKKYVPNAQALCQPPEFPQLVGHHPPMQCRGLKWEVLSNGAHPGMLGACCIVKEKAMEGDDEFKTFCFSPNSSQNIWLIVRKAQSIKEENFAQWKLKHVILPAINL
jgi:hypothetical protein